MKTICSCLLVLNALTAAEVLPVAPAPVAPALVAPATVAPPSAPAPAPAPAPATAAPAKADAPPGWQRPRVFLGALVEDGGSFDGKPMPRVTRLIPGSIFDKLGVKEGDQLAQINGIALTSSDEYRTQSAALKPGDPLKVVVVHDGVSRELSGVAEAAPRPRDVLADAEGLKAQVTQIKDDLERAKIRTNLEETLRLLREFEAGLPAAAADFKRVYPGGTFNIQLHVDIRSEATDAAAKPLAPASVAAPAAPVPASAAP